jgi:hypothetical protein
MTSPNSEIPTVVARLNARAWGIAFGLLCGIGLYAATMVLVIRGGQQVGPHLSLLSIYFPGYSVTAVGAAIGFIYAFVLGYFFGRIVGMVYDRLIDVGESRAGVR